MGKDIKLKMNPAAESLHSRFFRCKHRICKPISVKQEQTNHLVFLPMSETGRYTWSRCLHLESMLDPGVLPCTWTPALHLDSKLAPGDLPYTWTACLLLESCLAPGLRPALHLDSMLAPGDLPYTWSPALYLESSLAHGILTLEQPLTLVDLATTENKTAYSMCPLASSISVFGFITSQPGSSRESRPKSGCSYMVMYMGGGGGTRHTARTYH